MILLFVSASLIIALLIFLMFLILKRTVRIVNDQTKSYFVNKLQNYDDLIEEKENKLNEIDDAIRNRELGLKEKTKEEKNRDYIFDAGVIDILNNTEYQNKNIFELNKKIDNTFIINYESLINDFLNFTKDDKDYEFCKRLRDKFDSDTIYYLKTIQKEEVESEYKKILDKKEYKVYESFKVITTDNNIENFIDYLNELVEINSPYIIIQVGNKNENYNHMSEYIKTVYNDKIYRGIKIIYRNKVYDFSLSERDV